MATNLAEHLIASLLHRSFLASEQTEPVQKAIEACAATSTETVKVVILGGGTGLSNVLGGDSRSPGWPQQPFSGIKKLFPLNTSIVCVTDDGGSTGELLKDIPVIALGDLRHVLLSSISQKNLQEMYQLTETESLKLAAILYKIFNYRFHELPQSAEKLLAGCIAQMEGLPFKQAKGITTLLEHLFNDQRLQPLLHRRHCLGNLLLVSAIYQNIKTDMDQKEDCLSLLVTPVELLAGINFVAKLFGSSKNAVLPCTTTPARLKILYNNGVLITGEYKSAYAERGYPVSRLLVNFSSTPVVLPEVYGAIENAEIILLAPGSLYTSAIPVLQVPGIADAIRENKEAMKVLVSNLWVQKGETDLVLEKPGRRFHVSDLINAYQTNIIAGINGIFDYVLSLGLKNIPSSILQNYAVEGKVPIYLDKENVSDMGFLPIEAGIYSQRSLEERNVVHHDADALSQAIKALWSLHHNVGFAANLASTKRQGIQGREADNDRLDIQPQYDDFLPCQRFIFFAERINCLQLPSYNETQSYLADGMQKWLQDIFWHHADIPVSHLVYTKGIVFIPIELWKRNQQWDNVFSFYDPDDCLIKIRDDLLTDSKRLEGAFLVSLGQSLLGNYAKNKEIIDIEQQNEVVGKMYKLTLHEPEGRKTYLTATELDYYLKLVRMKQSKLDQLVYTRLNNSEEGFTPPGLLMGLMYSWYLDNRFAAHIEYKMAIMRNEISNLIPEQIKMLSRRQLLINFFRTTIFRAGKPKKGPHVYT